MSIDELKKSTVLVVDDEPEILAALVEHLESEGFTSVLIATSGLQAVDIFQERHPELVITDHRMAEGDGFYLLKVIRSSGEPQPAVVMMSAYTVMKTAEAYQRGADAVFAKPFEFPDLIAAGLHHMALRKQIALLSKKD